jgi:inhibitor of cysteine peptidase
VRSAMRAAAGPLGVVLLAASLVLVACDSSPEPTSTTVNLTAADNGTTRTLHPTDALVVTLDSNVTTGFRWELSGRPDTNVMSLEGSEYLAPSTSPGVVGAGGQEVWRFRAVGEGTTTLELTYQRASGETSGQPFTITVRVTPT